MRKLMVVAAACVAGVSSAGAKVMRYTNDFVTRESKAAMPYSDWMSETIVSGKRLAVNYTDKDANFKKTSIYELVASDMYAQGGFFMPRYNVYDYARPGFWAGTPTADDTNVCCYLVSGVALNKKTVGDCIEPLHNEFTNGVVRFTYDFRRAKWHSGFEQNYRVRPIHRAQTLNPFWNTETIKYFAACGACYSATSSAGSHIRLQSPAGDGNGGGTDFDKTTAPAADHWYRYELVMDLDRNKTSCKVYDQGTTHPEWGSPNGTVVRTFDEKSPWYTLAKAKTGGISGISMYASHVHTTVNGATDYSYSPRWDNIKVEWKAPGASEYASCYENDFTTRRFRTLSPAVSTTHAYRLGADERQTVTETLASYVTQSAWGDTTASKELVPGLSGNNETDLQPVGQDGWRRVNVNSQAVPSAAIIHISDNAGQALRIHGDGGYSNFVHPLGETITSGKVYARVDIRPPDQWDVPATGSAGVAFFGLGDAELYTSSKKEYLAHLGPRCGVAQKDSTTGTQKTWRPYRTTADNTTTVTGTPLTNWWYRCEIVADLDNLESGCEMRIWEIAAASQKESVNLTNCVYEATGVPFRNKTTVHGIGAIILGAYGPNSKSGTKLLSANGLIYFDNIEVRRDYDTAAEKVVYHNTFDTRTRTYTMNARELADYSMDDGEDGFIRRQGTSRMRLVGAENPCISASGNDNVNLVQPIGARITTGKVYASYDLRPPVGFYAGSSARQIGLRLGDDHMLNGSRLDAEDGRGPFFGGGLAYAGISSAASTASAGLYKGHQFFADNGSGEGTGTTTKIAGQSAVDTTSWYRFVVCVDLDAQTYSVKVHKMGTGRPAPDAAPGELVAQGDGYRCRPNALTGGFSCICLSAYGCLGQTDCSPSDAGVALFDNIKVWTPSGFLLVLE